MIYKHNIKKKQAEWCGPCKIIAPHYETYSKKYTSIKFLKVDTDELDDIDTEIEIVATPTFFVYKNGKIIDQLIGSSYLKLEELLKKYSS